LRLHPDDAALIEAGDAGGMVIEPDPTLERGSLVLEGPDGTVRDGPAEWRRAIAAALQR
jgi:flagellar assembly protein FliH